MKAIGLALVMWTATAVAQPAGSGSASVSPPTTGSAAASSGSAATAPSEPAPPSTGKTPREICAEALNADPTFAKSIATTFVGAAADTATLEAHQDADFHVQKNEKHVILAYAAMWVVAAMFVLFLWIRQQALKKEIAALRKDLDAAVKPTK